MLIFGAKRLPEIGSSLGKGIRTFKSSVTGEDEEKPTFAPLPRGAKIETITLDEALYAFKLPRTVGETADGQAIKANIGRFGPYIQIGKLFVSIKPYDPHDITLEQALELYDAKLKAEAEKNIADFGDGTKVLNGRYGPYIKSGKKNFVARQRHS